MELKEKNRQVGQLLKSGIDQVAQNNLAAAEIFCNQAQEISPDNPEVINLLGVIAIHQRQLDKALELVERSVKIDPENYASNANMAMILSEKGNHQEAIKYYQRALRLNPDNALLHNNLGGVYMKLCNYQEAFKYFEQALRIDNFSSMAWNSLGMWAQETGSTEEAVGFFRKAYECDPRNIYAGSNMLIAMHYSLKFSSEDIYKASIAWAEKNTPASLAKTPSTRDKNPGRKLRIGYVSSDLREHPTAYLMHKVLDNHDNSQFEIFCYSGTDVKDIPVKIINDKINWHQIFNLDDEATVKLIESHGIDILVDLSGHTTMHRLLVFARKPVPIQVTWMGYFDTTGMKQMDYIIADPLLIHAGEEKYYTEKPLFLPERAGCYRPPEYNASLAPPPVKKNGHITFGCFNNVAKISPQACKLWAEILKKVPGSKLFLKSRGFADSFVCDKFRADFTAAGVTPDRLIFTGNSPKPEYFAAYNEIDIGLDPFPYNGATTTLDMLWMGIPFITLRGHNYVSRIGESILHDIGLEEFVAKSPEEYIEKAVVLAGEVIKLESLRRDMRQKLAKSASFDDVRFTRDLEKAFRGVWKEYCANN